MDPEQDLSFIVLHTCLCTRTNKGAATARWLALRCKASLVARGGSRSAGRSVVSCLTTVPQANTLQPKSSYVMSVRCTVASADSAVRAEARLLGVKDCTNLNSSLQLLSTLNTGFNHHPSIGISAC